MAVILARLQLLKTRARAKRLAKRLKAKHRASLLLLPSPSSRWAAERARPVAWTVVATRTRRAQEIKADGLPARWVRRHLAGWCQLISKCWLSASR